MDQLEYCHRISELLHLIENQTARITNQLQFPNKLNALQVSILLLLDRQDGLRVGDVSKELHMADSNVSVLCTRLEHLGLLERERQKKDQRVVRLHLSDNARHQMEHLQAAAKQFQEMVYQNATEKDLQDIVLGMSQYSKLLELALSKNI